MSFSSQQEQSLSFDEALAAVQEASFRTQDMLAEAIDTGEGKAPADIFAEYARTVQGLLLELQDVHHEPQYVAALEAALESSCGVGDREREGLTAELARITLELQLKEEELQRLQDGGEESPECTPVQ